MEAARRALSKHPDQGARLIRVVRQEGLALRDGGEAAVETADGLSSPLFNEVADDAISHAPAGRTVLTIPIAEADAEAAGLLCGGTVTLLLAPVNQLPDEVMEWMGQSSAVALVCAADGTGTELAVTANANVGSLGDDVLDQEGIAAAREVLQQGSSIQTVRTLLGRDYLIAAAVPSTRALLVGDGPMADAISAQGGLLGWEMTVTNHAADAERFCQMAAPPDAVIVLSHSAKIYAPALSAALNSDAGYIGAMGSRKTQSKRAEHLRRLGHDEDALARIHGPVGLDLGSRTPAETAVAIAAEFLANRTGSGISSLSTHSGPIHR